MTAVLDRISDRLRDASRRDTEKLEARISRRITAHHHLLHDPDDFEEEYEELIEDHEKWDSSSQQAFHMIGFVVGLSNIWRFPFLFYNNGGSAFLIPYFCFLVLFAYPFVYLELIVGQHTQLGCIAGWKIVPLFKGVGVCMCFLTVLVVLNTQAVLSWAVFYLFNAAFFSPLPWISCDNGFGKMENGKTELRLSNAIVTEDDTDDSRNWHTANCREFYADSGTGGQLLPDERLPGSEFLRGRVQRMWKSGFADENYNKNFSNGDHMYGIGPNDLSGPFELHWDVSICLAFVMFLIIVLVLVGIRLNSKFLLVCVATPYIILITLLFRATGLPGSWGGVELLYMPNFTILTQPTSWWHAAEQVYVSTGCGLGVFWNLGSHHNQNENILTMTTFVVILNTLTSFLSSTVIFMFLGHVKLATSRNIETFIASGPELAFEVMADILGTLAKSNYYAVLFYMLLFLLGMTTVVTSLICAKTAFLEVLPVTIKYKQSYRFAVFGTITALSIFASLQDLTRPGLHAYAFQESFAGSFSLICCSLFFLIGVGWFWGLEEIVEAALDMGIRIPGIYFQFSWKFLSPLICIAVLVGVASDKNTHRVFGFDDKEIKLSLSHKVVGNLISWGPLLFVLIGAIHAMMKAEGKNLKQKFIIAISPVRDHKDILSTGTGSRTKCSHYFYVYCLPEGESLLLCCGSNTRRNKVTPATSASSSVAPAMEHVPGHAQEDEYRRGSLEMKEAKEHLQLTHTHHKKPSYPKDDTPVVERPARVTTPVVEKPAPATVPVAAVAPKPPPPPEPQRVPESKPGGHYTLNPGVSMVVLKRDIEPEHDHGNENLADIVGPIERNRRDSLPSKKFGSCATQ